VILAQVLREESEGRSLRDCCKAQGITVQTFIDWKARAKKHNQFDTLHLNGIHPERKPARFREEKPPTALQLALEAARIKSYPEDNPDDLHAVEHGEPEPPAASSAPNPSAEPDQAASGPDIQADSPISPNEVTEVAKRKCPDYSLAARGVAKAMYAAAPFLSELDQQTFDALGPRPEKSEGKAYNAWIAHRKSLMTPAQVKQFEGFFGGSRKGKPRARKEQAEPVDSAVGVVPDPVRPKPNGKHAPAAASVAELAAQHAEVSAQIAGHETAQAPRSLVTHTPRAHGELGSLAHENDRLKRALAMLTMENLQLRGLI
jgi:hypothetical protein